MFRSLRLLRAAFAARGIPVCQSPGYEPVGDLERGKSADVLDSMHEVKAGDVRTIVNGISKSNEIAVLQLTNRGWEVPGQ
jgi:hypothetical protein